MQVFFIIIKIPPRKSFRSHGEAADKQSLIYSPIHSFIKKKVAHIRHQLEALVLRRVLRPLQSHHRRIAKPCFCGGHSAS